MTTARSTIESILRDILDQPTLELRPGLRATDVEDWDSLAHISLIFSIEAHCGITFTDQEMGQLEQVDDLVNLVEGKLQVKTS